VTVVGTTPTPIYTGTSCLSQGTTAQLVSRVYASAGVSPFTGATILGSNQVTSVSPAVIAALASAQQTHPIITLSSSAFPSGTTITSLGTNAITLSTTAAATTPTVTNPTPITFTAQQNISCLAGHLQYGVQGESSTTTVAPQLSIDQNGVATAQLPGSVVITANISNAASSAGFFSTCPPASITLSAPGTTINPVTNSAALDLNNTQPLSATILDTNNVTLTGLTLEYVSTSPTTIPASASGTVTPAYAGAASITAICQPSSCNPAPNNQIGLFGNGIPVISNSLKFTTAGTNSTVLYMASTQSEYVAQVDFTTGVVGAPFELPYVPNSMVISNDGYSIYLGSSSGLMVLNSSTSLSISRTDTTSPGTVLAISPDGGMIVISDPVKQITTLESSSGTVVSTSGGVGTRAQFTPDSNTVYITAGDQLLIYSNVTGWVPNSPSTAKLKYPVTDVAVTVPSVGAYFASTDTTGRSYCPVSTPSTQSGITSESNVFYPQVDDVSVSTDRIAATNDGRHIIGVTAATPNPKLSDIPVTIPTGDCTVTSNFHSTTPTPITLNSVSATTITGVIPAPNSSTVFVTYTGSTGVLPAYAPSSTGPGTMSYIPLSGTATAPVVGVFSADSSVFYVGTAGDNLVHLIIPGATAGTWTDSTAPLPLTPSITPPLAPKLPSASGTGYAPVDLLVQKPRKTT
jgi:hypothetical protein